MRNILFPYLFILFIGIQGTALGQSFTASITSNDEEVCLGNSIAAYIYFSGGESPWDVVINNPNGQNIVLENISSAHTVWLKPESNTTYTLASAVDNGGRSGATVGEVSVDVLQSTPVSIVMDRTAFLYNDPRIEVVSSPAGGVFSGAGVVGNYFYPSIATPVGSPHNITCSYTNTNGCVSNDDIDLYVLSGVSEVSLFSGGEVVNALCDDGATYSIIGDNDDQIPGTFELVAEGSLTPIPGHITDDDLTDDEATFEPAGLSGAYEIIYTYEMDQVSVPATFSFLVNDLGDIEILDLPDIVCKNDDPYPLVPALADNDPGAAYTFSGPGVTGDQEAGYFYNPASPDAPAGENEINLEYTSSNGCTTTTDKVVFNGMIPTVDFALGSICLPVDGGTVSFTNMTSNIASVASWNWNFDDPDSGDNNSSTLENPEHFYSEPNHREITLTATTLDGCVAQYTMDTLIADQPNADFAWLHDCYIKGEQTAIINRSTSIYSELDTLIWTFKTSKGDNLRVIGSESPSDTIRFTFPFIDQYTIELHIENDFGCQDDLSREIILNPTKPVKTAGIIENFNGEADDWLAFSEDQLNSWVLGVPDFEGFEQDPGDLAWYTDLPGITPWILEHSWVQSPCYDLTGLSNPIIQMDLMKSFVPLEDGAVLQYQDLATEGWKTLGNVGEGLNWYNVSGLTNEPGGSEFGWGLSSFIPDTDWVMTVHDLDILAGNPHVKFRIAAGTQGTQGIGNQGFAFDNFSIGERVRYSVLEYFTNSSSVPAKAADEVVDTFAIENSGNLIDLQYHLDYPGADPMNQNNPTLSSARDFYYGVPGIPYAVLNGGVESDTRFDFSDPSQIPNDAALVEASLESPLFDVLLSVDYLENSLEATIKITCMADTFTSNLQLYVAVIEREVTAYTGLNQDNLFRNVVLDMLPLPTGKLLGNDWHRGKSETRTFSWDYAAYVEDIEDLSVVAFVQNRDNGEVLQADAKPHTPGVGIPGKLSEPGMLAIYPNPAVETFYVNFGTEAELEGQLQILDLSGRVIMRSDVQPGYTVRRMDVSSLSRGVYMICWFEAGKLKGRKKVVLIR